MPRTTPLPPQVRETADRQAGCLARTQLAAMGVTPDRVAREVHQHRWQRVGPLVVAVTTGPLERRAQLWAGVLTAGQRAALGGLTALELHGLRGWERPWVDVHVPRGRDVVGPPWVRATSSRRPVRLVARGGLPCLGVEDAALAAASAARAVTTADGLVAAVVQQRLTTPGRMREVVRAAGPLRHRGELLALLDDVEGGAQALSEVRLVRLCRGAGLPAPVQQEVRLDAAGRRRYLDALWELDDGRRVLLEVDGVGHVEEGRWYDDLLRAAEVARPGELVLRLPARALRVEPERVVALLRRHLGPTGCTTTR